MTRNWRAATTVALIACTACSPGGFAKTTAARELREHPADFVGKEVTVRGTVSDQMKLPFADVLMYRIADSTGDILVVSFDSTFPSSFGEAVVRGRFSTVGLLPGTNGALLPHLTVGKPPGEKQRSRKPTKEEGNPRM